MVGAAVVVPVALFSANKGASPDAAGAAGVTGDARVGPPGGTGGDGCASLFDDAAAARIALARDDELFLPTVAKTFAAVSGT